MNLSDFNKYPESDNIFVKPNIPTKKAENAIKSFKADIDINDIEILIDNTVFGSSKDGLLITNDKIYCKNDFESPKNIALKDIKQMSIKEKFVGGDLLINEELFMKFQIHSYSDLRTIFGILQEFIEQVYQVDDSNEYNDEIYEKDIAELDDNNEFIDDENTEQPSEKISLFQFIRDDNILDLFKTNKNIDTVGNVARMALGFFTGLGVPENTKTEVWSKIVVKYLVKDCSHIRENYIDKYNIIGLKNDIATCEIMAYLIAKLRIQSNINEDFMYRIIINAMKIIGGKNIQYFNKLYAINYMTETQEDLAFNFYLRLFFSNQIGKLLDPIDDIDIFIDMFLRIINNNTILIDLLGIENALEDEDYEWCLKWIVQYVNIELHDVMADDNIEDMLNSCINELVDTLYQ